MLQAHTAIASRNAGGWGRRSKLSSGAPTAPKWRNGVSLLGLALAGAAICTAPGRADTLDLGGATAQVINFDHTPGAPYDIVQNGILQLTNSGPLTFAGTLRDNGGIGGIFSLQKFGNGTLTLTGSNSYSGETLLNAGTLIAGAANSLSANSVLHSTGGAVDLAGFSQTVGGLSGPGLIGNSGAAAVTLTVQTAAGAVVGPLFGIRINETAGSIAFVKTGAGQQDQSNASNYTGGTTLTGGTLGIGNSGAVGTGTVTFNGPATLSVLASGLTIANDIVLTSDGIIQRSGDTTIFSGTISGSGALKLPGTGTIVLNGTNTYTGGTQAGGGVVAIGNDQALGTGAVMVSVLTEFDSAASHSLLNNFTLNNQLRVSVGGAASVLQLNGVLSGAGGVWLLPSNTGTLVLNSVNTYVGGTLLSSGVLQVNNNSALGTGALTAPTSATLRAGAAGLTTSNNVILQGTLTVDTNGNDYTLAGTVQDLNTPGELRKTGAGTLTLSGFNYYSGGTLVEAGVVAIGADAALGASSGALTLAGGDLEVAGTASFAISRNIVLNGAGGAFKVDYLGSVINLGGTVSGNGGLSKQGPGTLNLLAANSFSGGTVVTGGTLGLGGAGALGSGSLTLISSTLKPLVDGLSVNNALTVTDSAINTDGFNLTLTGPIGGSNFTKYGAGTLTLTGNNTLVSGVTVTGGALAIGSNTALGTNSLGLYGGTSLIAAADNLVIANALELVSGAPITFDTRAATLTLNGDLNYNGATGVTVNKVGNGTLITGGTWFGGNQEIVNVAAGNLQANGLINVGQLNLASGATLSGTGSIVLPPSPFSATVTIADGGNLSPGTATPGTLNVDNLVLSAGSQLNFKLGEAGVAGGPNNDLVVVHNQLTLAGTLNVTNGPFFSSGTYTLFTYGTTINDNGLNIGTLPSGYTGTVVVTAGDGAGGTVTLQALGNAVQYWDGSGALADHIVSGGSGTWNSSSLNWASADGSSNSVWNNQTAVFETVGGAVAVAGAQQFTRLQFLVDGYHLSGDGLIAVSGGTTIPVPEINVADVAATAIIDNVINGTAGLLKSGLGTLALNGVNVFSGGVAVSGGRLNLGNGGALGGNVVELFDATTLGANAAFTLANAITLDNRATVDSNGFALTLSGVLSGPGRLTITDTGATALAGMTTLTGSNTYTGGTTITAARASVAADAALGDAGGGLALNGSDLFTSASFASARAVSLSGDSAFIPAGGTTLALNGVIDGTGSLRQSGAGTLVLGGTNSYSGGTFVNAGVLSIAFDANLGAAAGGLSLLGATLQATGNVTALRAVTITGANTIDTAANTVTLGGTVTDTGVLTKIGSGTLALNGANSSVAATLLNQGTISVGSNAAIGGGGLVMADGTTLAAGISGVVLADAVTTAGVGTIDSGNGVFTLNGTVGGAGSVTKAGLGNLVLNGSNGFNGLNVNAGTVTVGSNTAAGVGSIALANATTLASGIDGLALANAITAGGGGTVDSGTGSFTLAGPVTGTGSITKVGTGNLVLNNGNSFAGLSVNAGTVTVGTNSAAGNGPINLAQNTTLAAGAAGLVLSNAVVTQGGSIDSGAGAFTLAGVIIGEGSLTKLGAGSLTLTGNNSYTGATSVAAGILAVNGVNGGNGAVSVLSGATLTGGGTITGVVTIADGATIAPGNGVGTLTTGGLVLGTSANLAYQLGQANVIGGLLNDLLQVNGNLTLGGKLNVTDSIGEGGGFGNGVYRLINYTGGLTNNGLVVNSLPGVYAGQIQTVVPGTVNLLVTAPGTLVQYWDGADQVGNGVIDGGSGTWSAAGSNWTSATPSTINSSWAGGVAVFTNVAGTVTLTGTQAFQGLQYTTAGYVLTGGTLNASAGSFIATGGGTTTIASTLTGGSITKQGAGTLALTGDNSFAALNITADSVSLGSNTAGGSGNIALADGTTLAAATSGLMLANTLSSAGVGTVDTGAGLLTLNGVISGPGSIAKVGSGTLALTAANSFNGLAIQAGIVSVGNNAAAGAGVIALSDGTTLSASIGAVVLANAIATAGAGTLDAGTGMLTLNGTISGPGSIGAGGGGNIVLNGDNSFTGLTINNGRATLGTATAGGQGTITIAGGATLAAGVTGLVLTNAVNTTEAGFIDSGSGSFTLSGPVTGGGISKIGSGDLVLNGTNNLIGLFINSGSVTIGNNSAPGNGIIAFGGGTLRAGADGLALTDRIILNEAGIVDTQGFGLTLAGQVTGQTLVKLGAGNLTLNGDNSYTGGTQLIAGTITVGGNNALGTGTLVTQDGTKLAAGVSGLTLTNVIASGGGLTVDSGADVFTLNGSIIPLGESSGGPITKVGAGNLVLGGNNSYNGLVIAAGRVTAAATGALGSGSIALADGTTLASSLDQLSVANAVSTAGAATADTGAGMLTLAGPITGAGGITKAGAGNLVLTATNSYAGATTVVAGTLTVDGSNTGTGAVGVASGATLTGSGSIAGVVTVANGATIAPGDGIGTLTTGGLVLNSGASLAYQLGQANVIGGAFNDLLQVNGDLTLGGGLTVTDSGVFGNGVYRLINYTGALTNNGLGITSLPGGNSGQIQTAIGGTVNLLITAPGALVQYWDGPDMAGNGKIDGGSGSWTATNTNWTSAAPSTINSSWAGGVAVFTGTAGTVTVTGTQAFQGLQFATSGYVLTGGTLSASTGAFIATNGGTTTISSIITGADTGIGALSKQGAGNLALNGANSFAGLNIVAGSVTLGSNTAGGTGGIALADGTTLAAGVTGLVLANTVSTAGVGTLDSGAGAFTLNGTVSGPGNIAKVGSGNLVLNGVNSFTGLGVTAGTVTLGTNTAGGLGGIGLADGTTLAAGVGGLVLANTITTAGVGTLDSSSGMFTLSNIVSGPGSITKAGSGNLVLNGVNSFTGLAINAATVTIGTNTAGGVGGIALADGTTLAAGVTGLVLANTVTTAGVGKIDSGSGVFTLINTVSGPGSISKAGSGNLVLNGSNSYIGLTIGSGTLTVGTNTAAGTGSIALANGTTLAAGVSGLVLANAVSTAGAGTLDSGAGVFTFAGPITGPGSITKAGAGNLELGGGNSFAGLNVNAGTVTVGTSTAAGSGGIALAGGTTLAAGGSGLVLANAVSTAGIGTIDSGAGTFTLGGPVTGPGSIAKVGSGTLALNGSNGFAGLGVTAGTVTVGSNTAAGTGTIALAGGTTLAAGVTGLALANAVTTAGVGTVNTSGFDLTLGGPITGPGSLVETGGGSLNLGGVDSYAGATTVASGQLRVTGSLTNSTVTLASGASIRGTGSVAGLVAGSGSTVAPSLGTAIGTLSVTGNAVFQPGATFAVDVGATTADRLTVGGTAALAGTLAINQVVGPLAPFTTYTLLSAAGGRSGTFGTVSYGNAVYNAAFMPTVSYTTTNVLLSLQAKSLVAQVGTGVLTQNERNVANAYDAAIATGYNPSSFAALFAPGLNLPDALNQLSGEVHSAERRVAMDDTRHVREAALDRLQDGSATSPGKDDSAATTEHGGHSYTLWARGVGAWGTNRSDGNGSAFNTSTGGAIVGMDIGFDGGKVGALFNYTTTTLDHYALGQSKVESTGGGVYAGYRQEHGFAAAAGASIAGIKARSSRTITVPGLGQTLAGRSDGNTYQAFADVSYDLAATAGTRIEPFARFAWVSLTTAAFTETGGSAALTASHGSASTQLTTAGLRGAIDLKGFTLKASAGAQHTGGDRSPVALLALAGSNSPAAISAVPIDKWALAADLSGEFRLAPNATFAIGYSGVNGKRTRDNGVRGTLTYGF